MRLLTLLLAAAIFSPAEAATGKPERARPGLVVVSVDGLDPDDVFEAESIGVELPELRRLAAEGASASGVRGVLPSVTYAAHTTIVTGVAAARHGIFYNSPFDPTGANRDGWHWYAEDIRVPTLWDVATAAGVVTASVDWPVTVGARITHDIVQYWRTETRDNPDDAKLARLLSTPGLVAEAEAAVRGRYPAGYAYEIEDDARRVAFIEWILGAKRPGLLLCYLSSLDEEQHLSGPRSPKSLAVLQQLDGLVGRIRSAAQRAAAGPSYFGLVSDHAHARSIRELRLNEALRRAGLILPDGRGKVTGWQAFAWGTGGSAAIMLKEPADESTRAKVAAILSALAAGADSPIQSVLDRDAVRDAGGFPEAAFIVGMKPDASIDGTMEDPILRPVVPVGEHGHFPENPELDATFFLVGPGVAPGLRLGRIDMRDVGPTLAARLGLVLPAAEGRDLLARP